MATSEAPASSSFATALRRLYLVRFVFAVAWAALLWPIATTDGPLLTTLLVVYPLFDAAAVLWQLRTDDGSPGSRTSQRVNVAVSILVAVALGWASTVSIAAALVVWGVWAVGAGIPQLLTALRNRKTGGQVPQILSGGISVLAGLSFLAMGLRGADSIAMVGGYATVGGVFFLISAIRLSVLLEENRRMTDTEDGRTDYDLIVVGGGPVGENVADYATKRGLRVAMVESELVGGECSYWACMPSKALLRSGQALRAARRLAGAREAITGAIDAPAVLARRTSFTDEWKDDGQVAWVESAGIDLIRGLGRLAGPGRVSVGDRVYSATAVALATGSVPTLPDIPGLADAAPWGTREATAADHVPPRLIVVGGGVAGTELAFAFASLGSQVTLLARSSLFSNEEPFVGELLATALADEGVSVRLGVTPAHVERDADGIVHVTLADGSALLAEELLVSTGRRPNTDDVGLETIGLDPSRPLTVDETLRVDGTDWLYAVGDVNGRALLTHQGKYQARAAGEAVAARLQGTVVHDELWGQHVASADHAAVPHVVFSDPEIASVGLTESRARKQGLNIRAVEYDLGSVAGAKLHADGYTGRAKLVVDEDKHVIVGATFVGQDVSELLHAATIAIVGEVTIDRLWHAVPAYPTISEIWLRLLENYGRPA